MVNNLLKITPAPGQKMPYAVAKAGVVYSTLIRDIATRMSAPWPPRPRSHAGGAGFGGGFNIPGRGNPEMEPEDAAGAGGYNPGGFGGAAAVPAGQPNPYVDRFTGEDLQNDREFKVLLAVVLDPAVPAAAAATQPAEGAAPRRARRRRPGPPRRHSRHPARRRCRTAPPPPPRRRPAPPPPRAAQVPAPAPAQ